MELVQEVYEKLKAIKLDWPEHAVVVVRDADGEIKFSSVGKYDLYKSYNGNIYMRGDYCLFNSNQVPEPSLGYGTRNAMEVITRSDYESYYYARENK